MMILPTEIAPLFRAMPIFEWHLKCVRSNNRPLRDDEITLILKELAKHLVAERLRKEDRWVRMDYMRCMLWEIKSLSRMKIPDLEKIVKSYINQIVRKELEKC